MLPHLSGQIDETTLDGEPFAHLHAAMDLEAEAAAAGDDPAEP